MIFKYKYEIWQIQVYKSIDELMSEPTLARNWVRKYMSQLTRVKFNLSYNKLKSERDTNELGTTNNLPNPTSDSGSTKFAFEGQQYNFRIMYYLIW
jgi:hypothetical protein